MGAMSLPAQSPARTVKWDCAPVLKKMRKEIARDPGRLILAMEDALTTSEACVCPIVRSAVDLAGHEPALTCEILIAAIRLLPAAAAQVTECVLLEAPETVGAVRAALAAELGEKSPELLAVPGGPGVIAEGTGNNGGKSPAEAASTGKSSVPPPAAIPADAQQDDEENEELDYPSVRVNGIYLISGPASANPGKTPPSKIIRSISTKKIPPQRPVSSVTESSPG
jgi:hypothetical protein